MSELSLKEKLTLKKSKETSSTTNTTKSSTNINQRPSHSPQKGALGTFFVFTMSVVSLATGLILFFYY